MAIRWLRLLAIWLRTFPYPFRPKHSMQASLLRLVDSQYLTPLAQFGAAGGFDKVLSNIVLKPTDHVVVLGGYHGDSTALYQRLGNCKVTAWEPVNDYANALVTRFSHTPHIEVIQKAAWVNDNGILVFLDADGTGLSGNGGQEVLLQSSDFAAWLNDLESRVRLLEINIEGSEYELLPNILARANRLPETILIQFHDYKPSSPLDRDRVTELLSQRYERKLNYPWVWEQWDLRQ